MRRQRRILVKAIGTGSIKTYGPIMDEQSRDFVHNLTKPAMDFRDTLLQFVHFPPLPCDPDGRLMEISRVLGITPA